MSIKIVPQEQLTQPNHKTSIMPSIPLVYYPKTGQLYSHRLARIEQLIADSPLSDYLQFCHKIVCAQAQIILQDAVEYDLNQLVQQAAKLDCPPLSLQNLPLDTKWIDYLYYILSATKSVTSEIDNVRQQLTGYTKTVLLAKAQQLMSGHFLQVDSNESLFIWSALSVYYTQLASQLSGKATANTAEQCWQCPVCQSSPTASIIHIGQHAGLRYLHCSLCESEWYVPRAKCTCCDNLENISYYSLDQVLTAIKTECCEKCHSYLKLFNQEHDPDLDIVVDDINSLILDLETEQLGFAKSGINTLLFSAEQ